MLVFSSMDRNVSNLQILQSIYLSSATSKIHAANSRCNHEIDLMLHTLSLL